MLAVEHLDSAALNAKKILGCCKARPGPLSINQAASVEYLPLGVIGLPMGFGDSAGPHPQRTNVCVRCSI